MNSLRLALTLAAALAFSLPLHAQPHESALSEAEIEQVRDCRYIPDNCVLLFVKLLDARTHAIQELFAKPRRPGREQDAHDLIEQISAIADEFADNLDDYGHRHQDIRKSLPKLLDATERWASALKSPPSDEAYNISRTIALESIRDLRQDATELTADQTQWFKDHPPVKDDQNNPKDKPSESR